MTILARRADRSPLVKICGLRRPADVEAARDAGADLIGLVFAPSRRMLGMEEARALLRAVPNHPPAVGVLVDITEIEAAEIAKRVGLDWVQLSGPDDTVLGMQLRVPYLRVIHMRDGMNEADIMHIMISYPTAGGFLIDAWSPAGGGGGMPVDWSVVGAVGRAGEAPLLLAGGLRPDTVATALQQSRVDGVDVSSGVEYDGWKSAELIHDFVTAVRHASPSEQSAKQMQEKIRL